MILPVGQSDGLRVPWVTGAVILACLALYLGTDHELVEEGPLPAELLAEAADYWSEHAYLQVEPEVMIEVGRAVPPDQRRKLLQDLRYDSYQRWPDREEMRNAQQEVMDFLTARALGHTERRQGEPNSYTRWGLVPSEPRLSAFFTHPFMHTSWLHLAANLLILFLAGAALEERLGAGLLFPLLALAALTSGAASLLASPASTLPLFGAAGVVAAVVGATLAHYRLRSIRCLYLVAIGPEGAIRGSFRVPALALLPLWLASAVGQTWLPGLEARSLLVGQAAGLVFGAVATLVITRIRLPERLSLGWLRAAWQQRAIARNARRATQSVKTPETQEEGLLGDDSDLGRLREVAQSDPGNPQAVRAFWKAAVASQQAEAAAPDMLRLVYRHVSRGEEEEAARTWIEVTSAVPSALAFPTLLVRLAPALTRSGERDQAIRALEQAVDPGNRGLTLQNALQAVEHAKELDPTLAERVARRTLELPDVPLDQRASLQELIEGAESAAASQAPTPQDALQPTAKVDSSLSGPRFSGVKIVEGMAARLGDNGLFLKVTDERMIELKYARVEALASAMVVRSLGQSPEVVIDLVLNWSHVGDEALRIVRLRTDGFDPCSLLDEEVGVEEAYRILLGKLFDHTGAVPLPDEESARGRPMRVFSDLETYQREVLEVDV
jgi:membrane associated rhomboid family serine protease